MENTDQKLGLVHVKREIVDNKITYEYSLTDGDVVGITLEILMGNPIDIYLMGGQLHVGTLVFDIIGYKAPTILICQLVK